MTCVIRDLLHFTWVNFSNLLLEAANLYLFTHYCAPYSLCLPLFLYFAPSCSHSYLAPGEISAEQLSLCHWCRWHCASFRLDISTLRAQPLTPRREPTAIGLSLGSRLAPYLLTSPQRWILKRFCLFSPLRLWWAGSQPFLRNASSLCQFLSIPLSLLSFTEKGRQEARKK